MGYQELRDRIIADAEKRRAEIREYRRNRFNLMKPFESVDDIPDIPSIDDPKEYEEVVVKNLIRCGAIPKDKLETGARYLGSCRNTDEAEWTGTVFRYRRYKFGSWYDDEVNHFQDDDGYDVFVPIKKL